MPRFARPHGKKSYRKTFHIFTEGTETEPCYFHMLKAFCNNVNIFTYSSKKTDPRQVLQKAKKFIKNNPDLRKDDHVWLVVDVDKRAKKIFQPLVVWEKSNHNYGLAISNPNFEFWLLLHFEKGDGLVNSVQACKERLKKNFKSYTKSNYPTHMLQEKMLTAIDNARLKHKQCGDNWHLDCSTSAYLLLENIFKQENRKK